MKRNEDGISFLLLNPNTRRLLVFLFFSGVSSQLKNQGWRAEWKERTETTRDEMKWKKGRSWGWKSFLTGGVHYYTRERERERGSLKGNLVERRQEKSLRKRERENPDSGIKLMRCWGGERLLSLSLSLPFAPAWNFLLFISTRNLWLLFHSLSYATLEVERENEERWMKGAEILLSQTGMEWMKGKS